MPRPWAVDLASGESQSKDLPKPPGYSEVHRDEQVARPCAVRPARIVPVPRSVVWRAQESRVEKKRMDQVQLKLKKAKELAWSPGKSFMMTGFMLWMSGNGVHIFSIMITFYAIYNPIKSAFTVNTAFRKFDDAKMTAADRTNMLVCKAPPPPPRPRPSTLGVTARAPCCPPRAPCRPRARAVPPPRPRRAARASAQAIFVLMNFAAMSGALYKMSLMGLLPTTPSDWVSFLAVPDAVQYVASGTSMASI